MAIFHKITIPLRSIERETEKAVCVSLPKGWKMWHPRKFTYRHPSDPNAFLLGYYDNSDGAQCFKEERRKRTAERVVPWKFVAQATGGEYTAECGYLTTLAPESKASSFRTRRQCGTYTPEKLEVPEAVEVHPSLATPLSIRQPATPKKGAARALTADQRAAVAQFQHIKVGALFMACGTGKTQTVTAIVNTLPKLDLLVWLCPCRCKDNTAAEIAKCGLNYTPHVFGIESMSNKQATAFDEARALLASVDPSRACIVLDESLTIKNTQSARTKRISELGQLAEFKFLLNGTPITKNVLDIYAQMCFLSPLILSCSLTEFKRRYAVIKTMKMRGRMFDKVTDAANMPHLLKVISPYTYTCSLELDVAKKYFVHNITLDKAELEEYQERKKELICRYKRGEETNMGAVFAKLLHTYCTSPAKFAALEKLLHGEDGQDLTPKTIVFCRYIDSADAIRERFPKLKVCTFGKDSIGLNLQAYNRIIYFDKTWDYAQREQSEARTHRTGQKLDCEYYDITTNTGIDRLIDTCIAKKSDLLDTVMRRKDAFDLL